MAVSDAMIRDMVAAEQCRLSRLAAGLSPVAWAAADAWERQGWLRAVDAMTAAVRSARQASGGALSLERAIDVGAAALFTSIAETAGWRTSWWSAGAETREGWRAATQAAFATAAAVRAQAQRPPANMAGGEVWAARQEQGRPANMAGGGAP